MKLIATSAMQYQGNNLAKGGKFEASASVGKSLIAAGLAKEDVKSPDQTGQSNLAAIDAQKATGTIENPKTDS